MSPDSKSLSVLLIITMLLGSTLVTNTSVLATPLHQEEPETLMTPDDSQKLFLPLVSVNSATEDAELETEPEHASVAAPQAGVLCSLKQNAYLYAWVDHTGHGVDFIYKAKKGYRFRKYEIRSVRNPKRDWYYGHSGQDYKINGFVLAQHVKC